MDATKAEQSAGDRAEEEKREKPEFTIGPRIEPEEANRLWRIYESVSKNIERENNLITARVTWALALSAGIVGAQGFILSTFKTTLEDKVEAHWIAIALSFLGVFFCVSSLLGVWAAQQQMDEVKKRYTEKKTELDQLGYPQPFGAPNTHFIGNSNGLVFPFVLLVIWLGLLTHQIIELRSLYAEIPVTRNCYSTPEPFIGISGECK